MMICVKYKDGKHGMVKPDAVDQLILEKKIISFLRAGHGWVDVSEEPVRGDGGQYTGFERREPYG